MEKLSTIVYAWSFRGVKYSPIFIHIVIIAHIISGLIPGTDITSWIYPIFGNSVYICVLLMLLSFLFKMCIWHQTLILNMLFNCVLEFITVNFKMSYIANNSFTLMALLTTIFVVLSIILRFKFNVCLVRLKIGSYE